MRLMLLWAMATMLPMAIDSTASTTSIWLQSPCEPAKASGSKRMASANAASFEAVPMNTVTLVGEPSYTSGIHICTAPAIDASSGFPLTPYTIDMPYNSVPDAMDPSTKYLMADSAAMPDSRSNATMAYRHNDISSNPRNRGIKLPAESSTMAPKVANNPST